MVGSRRMIRFYSYARMKAWRGTSQIEKHRSKMEWLRRWTVPCHLINMLSSSAIGGKTQMEVWSGKAAQDYDMLKIFGCLAYYHVKEDKLDSRAKKAGFLGFKRYERLQAVRSQRQGWAEMSHSMRFLWWSLKLSACGEWTDKGGIPVGGVMLLHVL